MEIESTHHNRKLRGEVIGVGSQYYSVLVTYFEDGFYNHPFYIKKGERFILHESICKEVVS
tara:strand:+ start:282 stop:464 length:183 start_codon:yes stop_codon:yes gene_type:complete